MIFPIPATYTETKIIAVDADNPDHAKYVATGEPVFKENTEYDGMILSYEIMDVITTDSAGISQKVSKEYFFFAEERDGKIVYSFVDMNSVHSSIDDFNKEIKRIIQSKCK